MKNMRGNDAGGFGGGGRSLRVWRQTMGQMVQVPILEPSRFYFQKLDQ